MNDAKVLKKMEEIRTCIMNARDFIDSAQFQISLLYKALEEDTQ